MVYKTFLKTFFLVFFALLGLTALINAVADPMMVLPFVHRLNNRVRFINERQQKTNQLYFTHFYKTHDFDGVILGSSRSSNMNPHILDEHYRLYNYAAAASRPEEASTYAGFAQKLHEKDLKVIVLGLDFMSANGAKSLSRTKGGMPVIYTQDVYKPFFTLANLFNLKALHLSTRIIRANLHPTKENYYERATMAVAEYFRPRAKEQENAFNETMAIYRNIYRHFHYNPDYKSSLLELKEAFPQTRFIVLTTPVAAPHLHMLTEENKVQEYKMWLQDVTDVFGEVYHFMDLNPVTQDYKTYFSDSHHLYPKASDLMLQFVIGGKEVPNGFGKVLTKDNIHTYLDSVSL